MPYRNPFYSKRAVEKMKKIKQQNDSEPQEPPTVNNFHANKKLTVGTSKNEHRLHDKRYDNKPVAAKSLNQYPAPTIKDRNVEDVEPTVNAKPGKKLTGKTGSASKQADFVPEITSPTKSSSKKKKTQK